MLGIISKPQRCGWADWGHRRPATGFAWRCRASCTMPRIVLRDPPSHTSPVAGQAIQPEPDRL